MYATLFYTGCEWNKKGLAGFGLGGPCRILIFVLMYFRTVPFDSSCNRSWRYDRYGSMLSGLSTNFPNGRMCWVMLTPFTSI